LAVVAAAFVAGSFAASPELRAYAAATIGSADIIDSSIQSVDIGTNQVKAADIAPDSVGGSEIIGASKLLFAQCALTDTEKATSVGAGGFAQIFCNINGVDSDDTVIATLNGDFDPNGICFTGTDTQPSSGQVRVEIRNHCSTTRTLGGDHIGIIVYDK
jgi:hypothetical protein